MFSRWLGPPSSCSESHWNCRELSPSLWLRSPKGEERLGFVDTNAAVEGTGTRCSRPPECGAWVSAHRIVASSRKGLSCHRAWAPLAPPGPSVCVSLVVPSFPLCLVGAPWRRLYRRRRRRLARGRSGGRSAHWGSRPRFGRCLPDSAVAVRRSRRSGWGSGRRAARPRRGW